MAEDLKLPIREFLSAFYSGNIPLALSYCDDEIDFLCHAPVAILPHLGHRVGTLQLKETWTSLHDRYVNMRYVLPFVVAEGNKAAVIIRAHFRKRDSGRIVQMDIADFYTFRDGRLLEIRQFLDSFDAVEQVLERDIASVLASKDDLLPK